MNYSKLFIAVSSFIMILILSISFAIHTSTAQTKVEWRGDDGGWCDPCGRSCLLVTAPRLPDKK